MMEDQYAEMQQTITTKDNPAGYYYDDINAPEYWPINPGYANGSVASNLGIFSYVLTGKKIKNIQSPQIFQIEDCGFLLHT